MLFLLLLLLGLQASAAPPGVKIMMSSKGLNYVASLVTDWIQEKLQTTQIPDVTGSVNIGIGSIHYTLSKISLVKVDLPQPSLTFEENTGLVLDISRLCIAVKGNWRTSFGVIEDGGTFDMALFDVHVDSLVQLRSDVEGHLSVECLTCKAQVGKVDVNFHGGAGFIIQAFVKIFPGRVRRMVENNICPLVVKETVALESILAAMNVSYHVDPSLFLNVSLTNAPAVQSSAMELDLKGVFYSEQHPSEPPFPSMEFQLPWQPAYMFSLGVSQFCLNSFAYACLTAGLLQINVNDSMIPSVSPLRLNTTSFGKFIPQLPKLFPNMLMQLQVYADEAPAVSLQMDSFSLLLSSAAKAFAEDNTTALHPLFTLNLTIQFSGKLSIASLKLVGKMVFDNLTLCLVSSEIGTFDTAGLENVATQAVKLLLLPLLNDKLRSGVPLPVVKGMTLAGPVLQVQQGFLAVFSDVRISRPSYTEGEL